MGFRCKITLYACVAAVAVAGPPARAQDVGGIINLMGRMMEQDMRNQQERRRQQTERRVYIERQRAVDREEQARINEAREQEVLLVKRLQSSLSKLGFYTFKIDGDRGPGTRKAEALFRSAFGIPEITLDESSVAAIEALAEQGFTSGAEHRAATAAGFQRRVDYLAAMEGGFDNSRDFELAQQQGFDTFEDFRQFRTSGFGRPEDFRIAASGGFDDRAEFEAAAELGFSDRNEYLDFRSSGHRDKAAFEAAKAEERAIKSAADNCEVLSNGDDFVGAVDACVTAVSLGGTAPLKPTLERLNSRIGEALNEEVVKGPSTGVEVASQAVDSPQNPDAGTFLAKRAALRSAQQKLSCSSAIVAANWEDAERQCNLALQSEATEEIRQLKAKATLELSTIQAAAEKQERERKEAADAEQKRLALNAARSRAASLLSTITDFSESKRSFVNAIEIAKAVVRLKQLEKSDEVATVEQAILNTDELLKAEPEFQKFLSDKQKATEIAQVNARATALAEIHRAEAFIIQFVGSNVLHEGVSDLLILQEKLAAAKASGQDEQFFHAQKMAKAEIERVGLEEDFEAFIYEENVPVTAAVAQADNGLAVTEENKALLAGDPKDVLVLGNFTSTAPHLIVNLLGDTALDGGQATYCWIGRDTANPPLFDQVSPILRKLGAVSLTPSGICNGGNDLQQDILIVERGALLARDILEVRDLIGTFEQGGLKIVQTVAWSEIGAVTEQRKQLSETIKAEVIAGVRSGFGFVQFGNTANTMCMVINGGEQPFHEYALAIVRDDTAREIPSEMPRAAMSLDRAFAGMQKNACSVIYAKASDMSRLLEALQRIDAASTVLPIWIDDKLINDGRALSAKSEQERQVAIAAQRQENEAAAALAKKQSEEAEVVRARTQRDLRDRYSQEARTAHNELSDYNKAYLNDEASNAGQFGALFPDIARWKQELKNNGWELNKYDDELLDYGTANWKGRKLEAILLRATVSTKNPVRGEYAESCFVIGYLIDTEFKMRRDAINAECGASADALSQWQTSRSFESRWVAR